jgi:hypothetical protein
MKLLFLLVALTEAVEAPSGYTLLMRGLVVGAESWTASGSELEFRTRFEFVRTVDLSGRVEVEDCRVRSLLLAGKGLSLANEGLTVSRWPSGAPGLGVGEGGSALPRYPLLRLPLLRIRGLDVGAVVHLGR